MSNIINPVLPVGGRELSAGCGKKAERPGNKFSDHLDQRLDSNKQERNQDQLGVRRCEKQNPTPRKDNDVKVEEKDIKDPDATGDVDSLVLFLQEVQQVAQEKTFGPGEWRVALPDAEILADLAEQAGMSQADLTALVEKFQADNGELDMAAFFQSLINHFVSFEENPAIVVAETELPMLESLLAKMGLSPEQLAGVSGQVVVGEGEIDLSLLVQALEKLNAATVAGGSLDGNLQASVLQNGEKALQSLQSHLQGATLVSADTTQLQAITLSPWEAQQLQDLLGQAGISLEKQLELLPEQVFGEEVVLSIERLQSLLKETVTQVQKDAPQLDLPKFLGSLEQVMKQAIFQDQSVGFSPVIQGSLGKAYQDLLDIYDQARLRFEEGLGAEEDLLQDDIKKWLDGVVARASEGRGESAENGDSRQDLFGDGSQLAENLVAGGKEEFALPRQGGMAASQSSADQTISQAANQPQPVRHFPVQQQQHILNQLSLAVARGMKSGEQHLVLRMHPVELGEVKVDLSIRNQVVSVSFTMENSKVKETLEGSMQEFRHSMEQKGFSLGDVNVFVGQNEEDNSAWQRFEMAWSGDKLGAQNLEDIPEDVLYRSAGGPQYVSPEEGVNLFV